MRLLILYGTKGGHTMKIADRLVDIALSREHKIWVFDCTKLQSGFTLQPFEAVFVGAPVYFGEHHESVVRFVESHLAELEAKPAAFFSVSLAAAAARPEDRTEAVDYVRHFIRKTGWNPRLVGVFAGALCYTQYDFVTRAIMKGISKRAGGEVDTTQDFDYTDWESVQHFAEAFLASAEQELNWAGLAAVQRGRR